MLQAPFCRFFFFILKEGKEEKSAIKGDGSCKDGSFGSGFHERGIERDFFGAVVVLGVDDILGAPELCVEGSCFLGCESFNLYYLFLVGVKNMRRSY